MLSRDVDDRTGDDAGAVAPIAPSRAAAALAPASTAAIGAAEKRNRAGDSGVIEPAARPELLGTVRWFDAVAVEANSPRFWRAQTLHPRLSASLTDR
jgi:hypothetical protein